MKPPPFNYHAPEETAEALDVLAETGGKVLAGGQSLIPLLNMRLAAPGDLIDINGIGDLDRIEVSADAVVVGAGVRHATLEHHDEAYRACPLLRQALELVAHPVIRNRGTVCGSIAHADPAGELTTVLAVLGGTVAIAHAGEEQRNETARDFFVAPLETTMRPGDLVTSVTFPRLPDRAGSAFVELARRHGDYALCGVAAIVQLDGDGAILRARTGYISVAPTPVVLDHTDAVAGMRPEDADWAAVGERSADAVDPESDLHATAEYRRQLARTLTVRALRAAVDHARTRAHA